MTIDLHPLFVFSSALSRHDRNRSLLIHQRRDSDAAMNLVGALARRGYGHEGLLFNQPALMPPNGPPAKLLATDISFVGPGGLILVPTRPPCHDEHDRPMKRIERAYTTFEQCLLDLLVPNFFEHCSREKVLFGLRHQDSLRPDFAGLRGCTFVQRGDTAPIKEYEGARKRTRPVRGEPRRTLVFHLYMPELFPGGPGCLMAFGMTGPMTLAWSYRLAKDHASLLLRPGFHVLQLQPGATPERPNDLRFTLEWPLEPVLMHDFPPGAHIPWMLRPA